MSEDQFTKLFKYMEGRFDTIEKRMDTLATKNSVERLTNTVDNFIARLDRYESEQAARDSSVRKTPYLGA